MVDTTLMQMIDTHLTPTINTKAMTKSSMMIKKLTTKTITTIIPETNTDPTSISMPVMTTKKPASPASLNLESPFCNNHSAEEGYNKVDRASAMCKVMSSSEPRVSDILFLPILNLGLELSRDASYDR